MKEVSKGWQDFWAEFFRIKHRRTFKGIMEWDRKLVTHAIEALSVEKSSRILDLACGGGDQALEFARRGMSVVGVDLARVLVDHGNEAARRENLPVELIQGDMRDARFTDEFDACVIVDSFGFFDDDGNMKVLKVVEKALKPGGGFYIEGSNPLKRMRKDWKGWDEVEGGYVLMSSKYDPETGKEVDSFFHISAGDELVRFVPTPEDEGFSVERRLYTLDEMIRLLGSASLRFRSAYGSIELPFEEYDVTSSVMVVVGEGAG